MIHVMLLARGGRKRERRASVQRKLAEGQQARKEFFAEHKGMS